MIRSLAQLPHPFTEINHNRAPLGRYAPFNIANLMSVQQRERLVASMLGREGLSDLRGMEILDVGCGSGGLFLRLMSWGVDARSLHGIDLQRDRVKSAQGIHPDLNVVEGNADSLPWGDRRFDVVTQFTTFTSILDDGVRRRAAQEIDRVLKPGGRVLWYDFWINPTNPRTRPLRAKEVKRLFSGYRAQLRRVTLAPPIARIVAPRGQLVAAILERIWFLQSHVLGVLTKPPAEGGR